MQIKKTLDDEFGHLPIDSRLYKKIQKYENDFINKNADHISFFGGHLMGVQVVRFDPNDRSYWFDDILELNEQSIEESLYALTWVPPDSRTKQPEPVIDPEFVVRSDVMNITCGYVAHRFLTTNSLPAQERPKAAECVIRVLLYKFLTSLLWNYFKYPANPAVAEATYNSLSLKFGLKRAGNWKKYLEERATGIVEQGALHYKTLYGMQDDQDFLYFIGDTQGRIRGTVKSIYSVFDEMNRKGIKIVGSSSLMEYEGDLMLKDKTNTYQAEQRYINDSIPDRGSFVKPELLKMIEKLVPTANPDLFKKTLFWMSDNVGYGKDDIVNQFVTKNVIYSFNYLAKNPKLVKGKKDISGILIALRGTYMSSRGSDDDLLSIRDMGEKIAAYGTGSKNSVVLKTIRTTIMLYVIGRILSKNYYTS